MDQATGTRSSLADLHLLQQSPLILHESRETARWSQLRRFMEEMHRRTGENFIEQADFHAWSVRDFRSFWRGFLDWSGLRWDGEAEPACLGDEIESARFFPEVRTNFADNLLSPAFDPEDVAVVSVRAGVETVRLTRAGLRERVEHVAGALRAMGLGAGDRVAAVARNGSDTLIVALAATALGATFSAAGPEMGAEALAERFAQIRPRFLFAHLAPRDFDTGEPLAARVAAVAAALPDLRAVIALDGVAELPGLPIPVHGLGELLAGPRLPQAEWPRLPFNHPLFVMFTSGTTGRPKCIVHGTGGVLLEQVKEHRLHCDLLPGDTLFFHTSPSWMMWNWQIAALASGARIVLYDGPIEGAGTLWEIVAREAVTVFGTSPPYLRLCAGSDLVPASDFDLSALRSVLSTGSILYEDAYAWIWSHVRKVPVQSISGGTDILGCFVLGSPLLPVRAGEAQCRSLGMDVRAEGASPGSPIGELVCANPFPSRPLGFLDDSDGARFHQAYFSQHPGRWTQGDLISITPGGGVRLHGRSDGVLNIRGIRVGPAEIYRILSAWPEIRGAMAVEQGPGPWSPEARMVLLLVLAEGVSLTSALMGRIRRELALQASPAHVPEVIVGVGVLPVTHSGKQSEASVTDVVNARPVRNIRALANPASLDELRENPHLFAPRPPPRREPAPPAATMEERIRRLWEELFGLETIEPEDDFFELGGSSLMAARLFADLREMTGRDLPIGLLLRAPRLRQLAEALEAEEGPHPGQIALMRPGREGHPLFLVHSMAGTVLELWPLRRALRTARPIYGIQARGLEAGKDPQACVVEMARDYAALIRGVQPHGPYSLGGYSFGGLVAFEIGRQLSEAGEKVENLILIDSGIHARFLPLNQSLRYRATRPIRDMQAVFRAEPGQRLNHVKGKATVVLDRLRARFGLPPKRPDLVGGVMHEAHLPPELRRVRGAILTAIRGYKPGRYAGKLVFIRAASREAFDSEPAWRKAARGGIEVRAVPGDHLSIITEPHVQALAREVDSALG